MAEQYFHPYYNQWDDGTIGMSNISKGEEAAVNRAMKWFRERNEWTPTRGADLDSVLRDPMNKTGYSPKNLPDILQPETMRIGADIRGGLYRREAQRFNNFIERYYKMPAYEQVEAFFDYPFRKHELDYKRVELNKAEKNLSNAEWLAFRDKQIEELRKTDPEFARDVDVVERTAGKLTSESVEHEKINDRLKTKRLEIDILKTNRRFLEAQISGFSPRQHPEHVLSKMVADIDNQIYSLEGQEQDLVDGLKRFGERVKKLASNKDFKSAHVNASNTLTKAGLNRPGFPLAGRLLSAPGIAADVSQIAAIAGVGPMKNYDNTGASYTNDEVVEVGGVKRVRSEVEELSAYHPDNAKNHPEISDLDRIDYFRRRGASKEVMSGLPGYEKWKSEQDSKNKIIINPSSVMFKPFFQ